MEESRRVMDPWEERVMQYASGFITNGARYVTIQDVLVVALDLKLCNIDQRAQNRAAGILRAHGWKRGQFRGAAGRVWGYSPAE